MKLSIITVNLNNVSGLEKTISSVISQSYKDFEYIIIDGGSYDKSVELIKRYTDKINYWISKPDSGIYNAMNKGLENASGEYCLFLNSGDYLENSDILNRVFSLDINEDFIYGDIVYQGINGERYITSLSEKLNLQFFYTASLWHQATFIKRSLFSKYGEYNEKNKLVSDWEFFLRRIIFDKCSYKKIDLVVTYYDMYNGLSVKNNDIRINEMREISVQLLPEYVLELLDEFVLIEKENKTFKRSIFYKFHKKLNKLKRQFNVRS